MQPLGRCLLSRRTIAALVVVAGIAAAVVRMRSNAVRTPESALASLAASWASSGRPIEARPSGGFAWGPFRAARRWPRLPLFAKTRDTEPEEPPEESGLALLLTERPREALTVLQAAAPKSDDAKSWNDLAVASYETAMRYESPELVEDALAGADRALAIDRSYPEALFNRALILERLGFRSAARAAWTRYLDVDATSGWAGEARSRAAALAPSEAFLVRLDRQYDRVANDPAAAGELAAHDSFAARGFTIKDILGRWGDAVARDDARDAERHLRVARQLAGPVTRNGDHMLEQAIAAIERSAGARRMLLATAHQFYRDGLNAYGESSLVEAESLLRRAASLFAQAGSPMVLPARFFAANTTYDQGRRLEAESQLVQLRQTAPPEFPAYRAFILWELGLCHSSRADWGRALSLYEESRWLFGSVHEPGNEAVMRQLLAIVYDRIGDPGSAWRERRAVHDDLGARASFVDYKMVASITDAAILRGAWQTAASFLSLHADMLRDDRDDAELAATLFLRAVVRDRLHDGDGSRADFAEAKRLAATLTDVSSRASMAVAERRAQAMFGDTPPAQADQLLTEAIRFQQTQSDPRNVPELLVLRARARRDAGNSAGAMADVERGIGQLERARESLPEGELRWGAFHGADELFEVGVELAIAADDAEAALRIAERARARSLLDSYGRSPLSGLRRIPAGAVIAEYVTLPARTVILTATPSGVRFTTVTYRRQEIAADAAALVDALRGGDDAGSRDASSRLFRGLVAPVEAELRGAGVIAFVPDATTSIIPFGSLRDERGAYLIERSSVVSAPSAAVFVAASERRGGATHTPQSVLVVTGARTLDERAALLHLQDEAREIAAKYPNAVRIGEGAGDPLNELRQRAAGADVIHFSGHAVGDDRGFEPASIVLDRGGRESRVGVAEIATLRIRGSTTVVLAGCDTARGERREAEGVISVAHGFLSAGASSVIATLWSIDDDAAAAFYPRLHRRLAQGLAPAEAVRGAQLESIRRGDVPPSLWAAVQDNGS